MKHNRFAFLTRERRQARQRFLPFLLFGVTIFMVTAMALGLTTPVGTLIALQLLVISLVAWIFIYRPEWMLAVWLLLVRPRLQ